MFLHLLFFVMCVLEADTKTVLKGTARQCLPFCSTFHSIRLFSFVLDYNKMPAKWPFVLLCMARTQEFHNKQYFTIMTHYLEKKNNPANILGNVILLLVVSKLGLGFLSTSTHSIFRLTKNGIVRKLILIVGGLMNFFLLKYAHHSQDL